MGNGHGVDDGFQINHYALSELVPALRIAAEPAIHRVAELVPFHSKGSGPE